MGAIAETFRPANPFQKFGVYAIMLLLFVSYSRVFDVTLVTLHVPAICFILVIVASVLCGNFFKGFGTKVGVLLLLFTAWMIIDIPFSIWRGGSFHLVLETWPKPLLCFIGVTSLAYTVPQCRKVMYSVAVATGALAWISILLGDSSRGRLVMIQDGKFSNPNDLAQALLIGLPFWLLMARNPNRTPFRRIIPLAFVGVVMIVLAKTASRGAFVSAALLLAIVFWNASPFGKLSIFLATFLVIGLGLVLLPKRVVARFTTLSATEEVDPLDLNGVAGDSMHIDAVASTTNRMEMFKESIKLTLSHPLFGVGPGMFEVAVADKYKELGKRAPWLKTHNSFTEVSSECGLPALALYLTALLSCLFQTTSLYRKFRNRTDPRHADIAAMAFALRSSLIAFAATACFSSVAYQSHFPCLAGLTVALAASARKELQQLGIPQPAPVTQTRRGPVEPSWAARRPAAAGTRPNRLVEG